MITATKIFNALNTAKVAEEQALSLMPKAYFDLEGMDNKFIYFKVLAKLFEISEADIKNIKLKPGFEIISENNRGVYRGIFKMLINH